MANILKRVQQLMQLALNNSFEEEARSSAIAAIRLMNDHGLIVTDKKQASPSGAAPTASSSGIVRRPNEPSHSPVPYDPYENYASTSHVSSGNYDIEVTDAVYTVIGFGHHVVRVQFTVEKAHAAHQRNACGLSFIDVFPFMPPVVNVRTYQFVLASGFNLFTDARVLSAASLNHWASLIVGTKYGASVEYRPMNRETPTSVTRVFVYGMSGRV